MLVISHMLHGSRWIVLDGHSKSGLFRWRRRHLWDSENQRARPHELTSRSCSLIGMGSRSLHDQMNPPYASPVCHNAHNLTFCNTVIKDEIKPGVENFQAVWFRDPVRHPHVRHGLIRRFPDRRVGAVDILAEATISWRTGWFSPPNQTTF